MKLDEKMIEKMSSKLAELTKNRIASNNNSTPSNIENVQDVYSS